MAKKRPDGEHTTFIQAFADVAKGVLRVLEAVEQGDDPAEALAIEAKRTLQKKSVRKVRGKPPRPKKSKVLARKPQPTTIDTDGYEV